MLGHFPAAAGGVGLGCLGYDWLGLPGRIQLRRSSGFSFSFSILIALYQPINQLNKLQSIQAMLGLRISAMWHIVYIIAFAAMAILAITNLVKNLIVLGGNARNAPSSAPYAGGQRSESGRRPVPHPELLDEDGQVIREPLLIMRSISVKDAREQLDALYNGTQIDEGDESSSDRV